MSVSAKKVLSLLAASFCISPAFGAELDWWVVNRFPVFRDADDFKVLEAAWHPSMRADSTVDAPGFTAKLTEILPIDRTAWDAKSGKYDKRVLFRDTHAIKASLKGLAKGTQCAWAIDDGLEIKRSECSESPALSIEANKPFSLTVTPDGGAPIATHMGAIQERLIVSLGDSFASGEGNPDHPALLKATKPSQDWFVEDRAKRIVLRNARWWDEACHRSLLSWPALAAMSQAIQNRREVVQFASFACSGAEVYDGILRAQADPPGGYAKDVLVSGHFVKRDGGMGYRPARSGEDYGNGLEPVQLYDVRLELSQQHALALLLCDEKQVVQTAELKLPKAESGVYVGQSYFGAVDLYGCTSAKRKVDSLLVSVGGNDVAFSGVVKWLIMPDKARSTLLAPVRQSALNLVLNFAHITSPENAKRGIAALPRIYEAFDKSLNNLNIDPATVKLLLYADPTEGAGDELTACNRRTRDGNAPFQILVRDKTKIAFFPGNSNFLFGINPSDFSRLNKDFVQPLRKAQVDAAEKYGWQPIDSQPAFRTEQGEAGYCAISPSCSTTSCSAGDRVKWWSRYSYSDTPPFVRLSDFEAYDGTRRRGMRYAVDALLAGAGVDDDGKLKSDWITNSAHPTANVHARIADLVRAESEVKSPIVKARLPKD